MTAVEEAAAVAQLPVSAQVVGNAFVQQYYHILHHSPGLVHRFYQDVSKLGRPEEDGSMSITTTMQAINDKIVSLNYGDYRAEIKSVDTQESYSGGFHVLVTGYLTGKDNTTRNFAQTFFLAPQDKGYFVLNDVFRYVDSVTMTPLLVNDVLLEPIAPTPLVQENHVLEQSTPAEEAITGEVYNPPDNEDVPIVEEEVPVAEVVNEVQDNTKLVVESSAKIEEVPKKSYASIVMHLNNNTASFSPPPSARKPPPKRMEQVNPAIEKTVSSESVDNGNNQEGEADGYSIYIKGLPMIATDAMLEEVFKKFGGIKKDGIQVRSNKQQGFCFGFVEYDEASSVQKALEASPVAIGGKQAVIEEKRSTNSRGSNNRGRFQSVRGSGFRNDGGRGRGNYGGGRSFNNSSSRGNGDFNGNRVNGEFNGNRGGGEFNGNRGNGDFSGNRGNGDFSGNRGGNRGGGSSSRDGYQRTDNVSSNGGRVNRNGGMANGSAKFTAPRVPATA